ncbi:tryptophan--tRNA ligase [Gammaproteobacteria bacterium]|nr:tryptophan--tRNA ligase [Gammaproteobacteria bacterium]
MALAGQTDRVFSGMRPTGRLHLGHYHGVLKNWVQLQNEYECFFSAVDWHALTTSFDDPSRIGSDTHEMMIDWLAAGVDPNRATLFIQSMVPEHAELHLLFSMITPLGWLERVPTYKEQQEKLKEKDLSTYGFLGYPLLQAADILLYKGSIVPVGEDQVPHIELAREVARRFNFVFGRDAGFEEKAEAAIGKLGKRGARLYRNWRQAWQERGDEEALDAATEMVENHGSMALGDKERLVGYLEGGGRALLPEPEARLTRDSKLPGLDGQKMSKSYNNTIMMRDDDDRIASQIRSMPTDPARVRLTDPGDPHKCPVWSMHQTYTDDATHRWIKEGCTSASIGCLDCKKPLVDAIITEQRQLKERARPYEEDPGVLRGMLADGCEKARDVASDTMKELRRVAGIDHRL